MKDQLRSLTLPLGIAWDVDRRATLTAFLEVLGNALACLEPLAFGLIVGGVATRSLTTLAAGCVLAVLGLAVNPVLGAIGVEARLRMYERVGHEFDRRVAWLMARIPTLDRLESPDFRDQAQIVKEQEGALGGAFNTLLNAARDLTIPLVTLAVAITADARLLWLLPASLPGVLVGRYAVRWQRTAEDGGAPSARLTQHLLDLTIAPDSAAELRVLGARPFVVQRLYDAARAWRSPHVRASIRESAASTAAGLVYLAIAAAVLVPIVRDAAAGRVAIGAVATSILAITQLQGVVGSLRRFVEGAATIMRTTSRYRWLEDEVSRQVSLDGVLPAPERLSSGIRLESLTFRYPGTSEDALRDVSLNLPAGAVVAVVGENGAGKSTLVKLLTGMYRPTGGRILIDGHDLAELSSDQWRARCSGAFQDHVRLELLAREAITVADLDALDSNERATDALTRAAAVDVLEALPDGLETQLGASWPAGTDLSGGQWQRLAIARGMMRPDPLLLVLDEPTAALDPVIEHALFESYTDAAHRAGRHGAVTLLVTHRFSTVAAADLVVVLAQGGVAEVGTHQELMDRHGTYAELYGLQARGYA